MIKEGCVTVGGKTVSVGYKVKPLDAITMRFPVSPKPEHIAPEALPLAVVHEDEHLVVVNKAAGMVVHPAHENWVGTLLNALAHHFMVRGTRGLDHRLGLLHRIDKDTSGLVLVAKTEEALYKLSQQFREHSIERSYYALVWGVPDPPKGIIDQHLARNPKDRREVVPVQKHEGKHAITHYEVVHDFYNFSLLRCRLETGRTHQIRVHMKHIGHPIFNDAKYGGDKIWKGRITTKYKQFVKNCMKILSRQALHAKTLGFVHPATEERVFFDSPLPEDMRLVISKCDAYAKDAPISGG